MSVQSLDETWQIVVVVTSENLRQLRPTLDDVQSKSLHCQVSILAADTQIARRELSGFLLPVEYRLPPSIKSGYFWTTVVSIHEFTCYRTIFLQAGTRVPQHWDARLVAAGQRAKTAIALSPQCARHPLLSAFARSNYKPQLTVEEVDQWLNDYVAGIEYPVPLILESCALLQGNFWRERSFLDVNDHEMIEESRLNGAFTLATDQLYVDDFYTKYFNNVNHLPRAFIDAFSQRHPLAGTHHALFELSSRREPPPCIKNCLPVQLHVGHSWGGGVGRWMEDYIEADSNHHHLVLRSIGDLNGFGQTIALYRSTDMDVPIKAWTLSEPILSINFTSYEYLELIAELIDRYSVESIVISSLVGHSLDLLRTILPTTIVLHDFFPFCPALYATFGSPCASCFDSDLRRCSRDNPKNAYFKFESDEHWLAIRREFVGMLAQESITVIAPSQSVVDRYRQLEIGLSDKYVHVIAHGIDKELAYLLKPKSEVSGTVFPSRNRLRIVILGRLTQEKGGALLDQIVDRLSRFADVFLLGTGESGARFKSCGGVTVLESYEKHDLGRLLNQISPDIGVLLSTVPETFSYTLSELWAAGIPVLATRVGAFTERVVDAVNGWLINPEPEAVLEKLRELSSDRNPLDRARRYIARQSVRTTSQMVSDYNAAMPIAVYIPVTRYNLPRRTYRNPYNNASLGNGTEALYVNSQYAYRQVLAKFMRYTSQKVEQTPKLPRWMRRLLGRSLQRTAQFLER